ncbi:hypothetical protein HH213_17225 [Duganella dendranthematis]|uniref:Uncharacterized protein n=1 Tax=Duganella dendranthematis TaxID=2728021 RepID=A0ABX6MBG4_9BURK|nr:hypothetical protein [Duganella dendranthematis]QJD91674.1 hypothetical protein HH213_17225 [Duganella dendranthematis]
MGIYFRNFIRVLVHIICLPMVKATASMTIFMMIIHMLQASGFADVLRQLMRRETYEDGMVIGGIVGVFKVLGAIGTVPMESNFSNAGPGIDNNEYINPATGLPLINPEAGAHGGIDIHNNFYGSSSNEF